MPHTHFQRVADSQGWSEAEQTDILLDYIARQDLPAAFADFLGQAATAQHDDAAARYRREIIALLGDPDLAGRPAFRSYCAASHGRLTPRQAAERWCCWQVA